MIARSPALLAIALPVLAGLVYMALGGAPVIALLLVLALLGGALAMLFGTGLPRAQRYAIGLAFFGFLLASLISNYPTPLAGYGAAAILGFALAHALAYDMPRSQEARA